MKIAFLNLCHCDPDIVARVANKLTKNPDFDMYIHVDEKTDIAPFESKLNNNSQVYFIEKRQKVYWGGYNAIEATMELLRQALAGERNYDYFMLLQNLDYPIKSNKEINDFFEENAGREFIRGCKIAHTKDWLYSKKYKLFYRKDSDFCINNTSKIKKMLRDIWLGICSIRTIGCNGVIHEDDQDYEVYYGAAQWAVTRACAQFFIDFEAVHPRFNKKMKIMQFPDEEYFHTVVHNSKFKTHCMKYDEPEKRWLVNWRNLHYFEFPKTVTIFEEKDFQRVMAEPDLFCRKVKTGISERFMDRIDEVTGD